MRETEHETTFETSNLLTSRINPSIILLPGFYLQVYIPPVLVLLENVFAKFPHPHLA